MAPDSLGTFVSFLLLLAPGIVWELQRNRYHPAVKQTAIFELAQVVLASLLATGAATILLIWVWIPLYQSARSADFSSPLTMMPYIAAVAATSLLACGLALLASWKAWPGRPPIAGGRVWNRVFVDMQPKEAFGSPYLIVELLDGTVWRGRLAAFDSDPEDASRTLAIGPSVHRKRPGAEIFDKKEGRYTILPESQIKSIQVAYTPPE